MRWDNEDGYFEIKNQESLEEVVAVDCVFGISIYNAPSLRRVRCLGRNSHHFSTYHRNRNLMYGNNMNNNNNDKASFLKLSRCGGSKLEEIESSTHLLNADSWEELESESLQNSPVIKKLDINCSDGDVETIIGYRNVRDVGISISRCSNLSVINNYHIYEVYKIAKIEDCEGLETVKIGCVSDGFVINNLPSLKLLDIKSFSSCANKQNNSENNDLFEAVMMQISEISNLQHLCIPSNPFACKNQIVSRQLHQILRKVEIHEFNGERLSIVSSESALEEIKISAKTGKVVEISDLPNLKVLEVERLKIGFIISSSSSDRSLFISRLSKLRKLVVKGFTQKKIWQLVPCLEEIVFQDVGLIDLVGLKSLKTVNIVRKSNVVKDWKFQNCTCLKSLEITDHKYFYKCMDDFLSSKLGLVNLPSLNSFVIPYSCIRLLDVRNCGRLLKLQIHLEYFRKLKGKGFEIRGTEFPKLKQMIVTVAKFHSFYTDEILMKISKLSCLTSLKSLRIGSFRECVFESVEGMDGSHNCEVLVSLEKVVVARFNSVKSYVYSFKR